MLAELDALKAYYEREVGGRYFINIEDFSRTFLLQNWKLGALFFEYLKWQRNLRKIYFDDFVVIMENFHCKKSLKHKILHLYQVGTNHKMLDINQQNRLSFWDIKRGFFLIHQKEKEEQVNHFVFSIFKRFNKSHLGTISKEEFLAVFNDPGLNKSVHNLMTIDFVKLKEVRFN